MYLHKVSYKYKYTELYINTWSYCYTNKVQVGSPTHANPRWLPQRLLLPFLTD